MNRTNQSRGRDWALLSEAVTDAPSCPWNRNKGKRERSLNHTRRDEPPNEMDKDGNGRQTRGGGGRDETTNRWNEAPFPCSARGSSLTEPWPPPPPAPSQFTRRNREGVGEVAGSGSLSRSPPGGEKRWRRIKMARRGERRERERGAESWKK
jgi:hypothetical protein